MASKDEIYTAIRKADAAGDTESVRKLGAYLKTMDDPPFDPSTVKIGPDGLVIDVQGQEEPPPPSFMRGLNEGIEKPIDNVARALEGGINMIPGAKAASDWIADQTGMSHSVDDAAQLRDRARDDAGYGAGSSAGKFTGEMLATIPAARLGPIAGGAVTGAALTDNPYDPARLALDTLTGGVGGKLGDLAMRGIARAVAPAAQKLGNNVRLLIGEGVTALTPGQIARDGTSRAAKKLAVLEDRAAGQPIVGGMIQADRQMAEDQLNRAVGKRILGAINETLPDSVPTGHKAVAYAGDRLSDTYSKVIPRLNGAIDASFQRRLGTIIARTKIPQDSDAAPKVAQLMREAGYAFTNTTGQPAGAYSGRSLRDATDKLDKLASLWRKSDDPYTSDLGDAAGKIREELLSLAARQNPADAATLRGLNKGWAMLVRMEAAAKGAKGGRFSPAGLTTAVRTADRSTRKRSVGRGEALLQDLSDAASQVMPSTTGSSGTSERAAQASLAGWASGAAQAIPYSVARRDLARQQTAGPTAQYIADLLRRGAPLASRAGSVAAPGIVSGALSP